MHLNPEFQEVAAGRQLQHPFPTRRMLDSIDKNAVYPQCRDRRFRPGGNQSEGQQEETGTKHCPSFRLGPPTAAKETMARALPNIREKNIIAQPQKTTEFGLNPSPIIRESLQ